MMKSIRVIPLITGAFLCPAVIAQEAIKPQQQQPRLELRNAEAQHKSEKHFVLLNDLIGRDILDAAQKDVGEIEDFMIDLPSGRVAFAVCDHTMFEDQYVLVPTSALNVRYDEDSKKANSVTIATEADLKKAPMIPEGRWEALDDPSLMERLSSAFPGCPRMTIDNKSLRRASEIFGKTVSDTKGDRVGELENATVDLKSSEISHAVLGTGGVVGIGESRRAIPWNAVRPKEDSFIVAVDKERIKNGPEFDPAKVATPHWVTALDQYYGGEARPQETTRDDSSGRQKEGAASQDPTKQDRERTAAAMSQKPIVRATELRGLDITTPDGEDIAEIKDLAIDANHGKACFALAEYNDKWVALALNGLRRNADGKLVLTLDKAKLDPAQALNKDDWTKNLSDSLTVVGAEKWTLPRGARILSFEKLVDFEVKNLNNDKLGELEDLAIEPESGKIQYVALGAGGVLGIGEKWVPVPWEALKLKPEEETIHLDVTTDQLKKAPTLEDDKWPSSTPREVFTALGLKPVGYQESGDEGVLPDVAMEVVTLPLDLAKGQVLVYHITRPLPTPVTREEGSREPVARALENMTDLRCRIEVQEESEGLTALRVRFEPQASKEATRRDLDDPTAKEAPVDQNRGQSYIVRVGRDGFVKDVRADSKPATTGAIPEEEIRCHVQTILGAGLHQDRINPGQTIDDKLIKASSHPMKDIDVKYAGKVKSGDVSNALFTMDGKIEGSQSRVGRATYNVKTGLLEEMKMQCPKAEGASEPAVGFIIIRRVEDTKKN